MTNAIVDSAVLHTPHLLRFYQGSHTLRFGFQHAENGSQHRQVEFQHLVLGRNTSPKSRSVETYFGNVATRLEGCVPLAMVSRDSWESFMFYCQRSDSQICPRRTTGKAFAQDVFIDQELKLRRYRRSLNRRPCRPEIGVWSQG